MKRLKAVISWGLLITLLSINFVHAEEYHPHRTAGLIMACIGSGFVYFGLKEATKQPSPEYHMMRNEGEYYIDYFGRLQHRDDTYYLEPVDQSAEIERNKRTGYTMAAIGGGITIVGLVIASKTKKKLSPVSLHATIDKVILSYRF